MNLAPLVRPALITVIALTFGASLHAAAPSTRIKPNSTIIPLPLKQIIPVRQRICTSKAASGLGTTPLRAGSGVAPGSADSVRVNYIGYLAATGEVFDQGTEAVFPVNAVISGFGEGLTGMTRGAVHRLCIPAALGYGDKATGPIPANADLVFQVELLDFKTAAQIEALRGAEPIG
jgi:FKBP-type peptidyl-prolyl cis-trans isomerase FkpA